METTDNTLRIECVQLDKSAPDSYYYPVWVYREDGKFLLEATAYTPHESSDGDELGFWHSGEMMIGDFVAKSTDFWIPVHIVQEHVSEHLHIRTK